MRLPGRARRARRGERVWVVDLMMLNISSGSCASLPFAAPFIVGGGVAALACLSA